MAGKSETEIFEEQVADTDIKMFIDFTNYGLNKNIIPLSTGDQKWKICSIVWISGMLRYFEPRVASSHPYSTRPLTFLETLQLILSMQQLDSEAGSVSYKARDVILSCCSSINKRFDQVRDLHNSLLLKVKRLFDDSYGVPRYEPEEISSILEIEMYADLLRRKCATGVRGLRRSDQDWEIRTAILGSGVMRYLKRSMPSPDAPEVDQHLPILQIIQLLLMKSQADSDPSSIFYKARSVAIYCCSALTRRLGMYQELRNNLLETVRHQLWRIVTAPLDLLPSFRIVTWY